MATSLATVPPKKKKKRSLPILDFTNPSTHWHRCFTDGQVWAHSVDNRMTSKQYDRAHSCPKCGNRISAQTNVTEFEKDAFLRLMKGKMKIVGKAQLDRRFGSGF